MQQTQPPQANSYVRDQYLRIAEELSEAAIKAGRNPADVQLMAVTKTVDEALICEAIAAGAQLLGENKVQELARKRGTLPAGDYRMHLIGHLQSNKAAKAAECADMIQSVDSVKLARELSRACEKLEKKLDILLEVNIGNDPAKFGVLPEQLEDVLGEIAALPGIAVRGLMTVPPFLEEITKTATFFSQMHKLFIDIRAKKMDNISMEILSMGMSADFACAVQEGSTLVRVGSAIFGRRDYR